jgi:hypothetical protein
MIPARENNRVARLFISQQRIDRWVAEERVTLEGDRMILPSLGATFRLRPAVHFVRSVSEDGDPHELLGRVKSEEQLRALGGELYASSVIVGESAYDCETGFVAEVVARAGSDHAGLTTSDLDKLPGT